MRARVDGTRSRVAENLPASGAGPTTDHVTTHVCEVCNATVSELRRGRCWGCYRQWADDRPVGVGARCVTCSERRRRVLRTVELFGSWKPMCFNCVGQVLALDPMPMTIAGLRERVSRERRRTDRRLGSKRDGRVFCTERRVGERRVDQYVAIDDDMIIEICYDPVVDGFDEPTRIHGPFA